MCIISQPVESVQNTRIFVGVDEARTTQLCVYSMSIEHRSSGPAPEMLLPIPATYDAVQLLDFSAPLLKGWNDLLYRQFNSMEGIRTLGGVTKGLARGGVITKVVGSYTVRLYSSIQLYAELHPEVPASVISTLEQRYSPADTLLAATLRDPGNYHPLAFTFPVTGNGKLYVPTYHLHHGKPEETSEWDHHIYYGVVPHPLTEEEEAAERRKGGVTHPLSKLGLLGPYTTSTSTWPGRIAANAVHLRAWRFSEMVRTACLNDLPTSNGRGDTENLRYFPIYKLYESTNPYRNFLPKIQDLRQLEIKGHHPNRDIWLPLGM